MSTNLKIYSHKIRWSGSQKQHLQIVEKIKFLQPDVVCLQEVALGSQAKLFEIEGYKVYYHPVEKPRLTILASFIKPLFNIYKNLENQRLYKTSKLKKSDLKNRFHALRKSLKLKNFKFKTKNHNDFLKGYLMVLVKKEPQKASYKAYQDQGNMVTNMAERITGKGYVKLDYTNYFLLNTHLLSSHKKKNMELDQNNENQFKEILETLDKDRKTILIGDFNFGPESKKYILAATLFDLTKEIPITEYYWKTRLDYIFTNFKPIYSSCNIVQFDEQPSDHYGIWCELEF